jgi:MFS family permease
MSAARQTQAVLAAGHGLNAMSGGFVFPFLAVYIHGHSSGAYWVGIIFALTTFFSAVGRTFGGELADRRGRRFVVVVSVGLRSLLLLAMGIAVAADGRLWLLSLPLLLSSIARGAYEPAADAMIADLVPPPERPRVYASMRIARNAGWAVGPALGGFAGAEHFHSLAIAAAALGFINLLLSVRYLRETPHQPGAERFHVRDLAAVLHDRVFRAHCLLTGGLFVLFSQLLVSVSVDFAARVALTSVEIGWAYTLNGILVVVFQAAVTRTTQAVPSFRALGAGALLYGAGYFVVGVAADLPLALVGITIVSLAEMITLPLSAAVAADLAPADRRGRYLGAYGVFMDVGHGLGQIVGGVGLAAAGPRPLYFWSAVLAFAFAVAFGYRRFGRRYSR